MFRALPALALLAACTLTAAPKDPWLQLSSPHFEVLTDANERTGRDVIRHFEEVHAFFEARFKTGIDPTRKPRVLLFRNPRDYERFAPNPIANAFFHPGEFRDFIVLRNWGPEWKPTAVHELTHLMVRQLARELPLWLNEGLAELYSTLEPKGSQVMVGRDLPGRMQTLARDPWIALTTLFRVDQSSPIYNQRGHAGIFYAESWKLVHMLHLHPDYAPHLTPLLLAILQGDPEAAFRMACNKSVEQVERDLHEYMSGGTINALLFDITLPKSIDTPQVTANATLAARLSFAELLSSEQGRLAEAGDAYAALERDYPDRWEIAEAQALFAWHLRRVDDAIRYFAQAQKLGCNNGATYLLWGRILGFANRTPEAIPVLAKAVHLLPDAPLPQLEYADALVRNKDFAEAIPILRAVTHVPQAGAWRYYYDLAYSLYRTGDLANARPYLANARKYAGTPRERSLTDQLDAAIQ
jgi:tetratricopeptide (TPR) repeat protein